MADSYLRNLPVPFFSQRQNDYLWKERYLDQKQAEKAGKALYDIIPNKTPVSMDCRTCNITSVMMVMKYLGLTGIERTVNDTTFTTPSTPKELLTKYFNHEYDFAFGTDKPTYGVACLEDWYNLRKIGQHVFGAECTYDGPDKSSITLKNLKEEIANGYPVCISIGMEDDIKEGHVVVVRGFTKIGSTEYIILNDPWGSIVDDEFIPYDYYTYTNSNNQIVKSSYIGSYFYGRPNDSSTNGDNVIVKLSDFRAKLVKGNSTGAETNTYFHNYMTIHSPLWNFPDGTNDFSTEEKQASIYSKVRSLNGGYPLNKNNVWHTGMHLAIDGNIHSIGPARLVAVRNSSVDKDIFDKSFILLEHQLKLNDEVKYFYSLYMHLKNIDLKKVVNDYFCNGIESPFLWLNQLLKKLLGYNLVVKNLDSSTGTSGQINDSYKNIKLYKVERLEDGTLIKDTNPSEKYLGRRCLINPLPIQNQKIYPKLLDPEKYNDDDFKHFLKEKSSYSYNNYIYFFLDDGLYATEKTNNFEYGIIFYKQILTTAKQIYDLQNEDVVAFNEVKNYCESTISEKLETSLKEIQGNLKVNLNNLFEKLEYSKGLQIEIRNPFLEIIDACYTASILCGNNSELSKIQKLYKKYMEDVKKVYTSEFLEYQKKLEEENKIAVENAKSNNITNSEITLTWKNYLQDYCCTILNSLNLTIPNAFTDADTEKNGKELIQELIKEINKIDISISSKMSIYENLIIWLEKLSALEIKDFIYFENTDSSIMECKNQIISNNGLLNQLYNLYTGTFTHYLENEIEIGRNEIIGECGNYETMLYDGKKTSYQIEPQIHFEIFSEDENIIQVEKNHEDLDSDILYNPHSCIEATADYIREVTENFSEKTGYLDDNMLKIDELKQIYEKSNNMFLSDLCLHIKSQWGEKENKTKQKYYQKRYIPVYSDSDTNNTNDKNDIDYDDFFEKYIKPFMWFSPQLFKNQHFRDGCAYYYHPLYFIEKLIEEDKK